MFVGRLADRSVVAGFESSPTDYTEMKTPFFIDRNQWIHWALVTGPGGMELYVNGVLAGTNAATVSFAALSTNQENLLGHYDDWRDSRPKYTQRPDG